MKRTFWIFTLSVVGVSKPAWAIEEGMTQMPKIGPKSSYTVQSSTQGEDLFDGRGFGDKEPMVRMMNLMMVEGSGYEGMDMGDASMKAGAAHEINHDHQMKIAANDNTPMQTDKSKNKFSIEASLPKPPAKVGANLVTVTIRDAKTKELKKGLKPKAQVSMTSMDMGTDEPRVREVSPGNYQFNATFSMKGPWAVKLLLPNGQEETISFSASESK